MRQLLLQLGDGAALAVPWYYSNFPEVYHHRYTRLDGRTVRHVSRPYQLKVVGINRHAAVYMPAGEEVVECTQVVSPE